MKIVVIEWEADDAMSPDVCLGSERDVLWSSAVAMYERMKQEPEQYGDTLREAGDPHEMLVPELYLWHHAVHEQHTSPWATFYTYDGDDPCAEPDNDMNRRLIGAAS